MMHGRQSPVKAGFGARLRLGNGGWHAFAAQTVRKPTSIAEGRESMARGAGDLNRSAALTIPPCNDNVN
jgi:hypothetical protein